MNKQDDLKKIRLQEEVQFLNPEWIELLAKLILDEHTNLVNKNIFGPSNGALTYSITLGSPNAGIAQGAANPYSPKMEIRLKLIEEIYRNAFGFTLISNRIGNETNTLKNLHEHDLFKRSGVIFETALPEVKLEWVAPVLQKACIEMEAVLKDQQDERIGSNEIRCRFIMFELMLVWTFYHEVGHALQRHYVLRTEESAANNLYDETMDWDLDEYQFTKNTLEEALEHIAPNQLSEDLKLKAQARELMADIEGIGIVLSYLATGGRLHFNIIYLLNCSLGCMFQFFYNGYPENLAISPQRHPHPAVRDHIVQSYILTTLTKWLLFNRQVKSTEEAHIPLTYINIRASLMTGLYRSHRIETRESEDELPSYMKLHSKEHQDEMRDYIKQLHPHIQNQITRVMKELHIIPNKSELPRWVSELQEGINSYS